MPVYLNGKKLEEEVNIVLKFRHPNDKIVYPDDMIGLPTCGTNDLLRLKIEITFPDGKGFISFDSRELMDEVWNRQHIMMRCKECTEMWNRMK